MARYPHLRTTAIAIAVLLVAACGSDDDVPDGLRDIRDTEPADTDPDEADDPDGGDTPNDDSTDARDEPAEPDEPDPEPDSDDDGESFAGVTVPDDALQVNDDLDMPPDQQLEYLNFALDAFLYATRALNTGEWDPDQIGRYFARGQSEALLANLERYELEGLRQVTEGAVLEYLRIHEFDDGVAIVHRCVADGPKDGVIDIDTGEYTFESDTPHWLAAMRLEPIGNGGANNDLRVVQGGGAGDAPCP